MLYNDHTEKKLRPNANVQKSPRETYVHSYITFIWLHIIESISNTCTLSSYNSIDSYNSTYKDVLAPDYLLGYSIKARLQRTPENIAQTSPVTNYTNAYQKAPHAIIHFYIILRFYILIFFAPACHQRKKISSTIKLSHSSLLHPRALHTSFPTYKYYSKIDPIK